MFFTLAIAAATACPGTTTPQVEACFAEKFDADVAAMNRYRQAALDRIAKTEPAEAAISVTTAFLKSDKAWDAYREAECDAVTESWTQASIRGLMALQCKRRLTQFQTHAIWSNWLTYADNSPPTLPEPPIGKAR